MNRQPFRAPAGGLVDRARPLSFSFDGRWYEGFAGDTLASALVANGVRLSGRSFKYHRPRGLIGAGVEESNVLVTVGSGARTTTNLRATEVELQDGLEARPVNCWPSLAFDVAAVNNLFSRFLAAGFYYKTFMWPHWHWFEGPIRRAAGLGRPSTEPDPDRYEVRFAHCDVLVIGGGPAGLAAAQAAAGPGVRVILAEQESRFGGSLNWRAAQIEGVSGAVWAQSVVSDLARRPGVRLLTRTTAIGYYDHNSLVLLERPAATDDARAQARERLWQVRAKRVVLACGALERPLVFPGNDRPGVMLASAAHRFAGQYGARSGDRVAVFTNNDVGHEAAWAVADAGAQLVAVIDSRTTPDAGAVARFEAKGVKVFTGGRVIATRGGTAISAIRVRDKSGRTIDVRCDSLLMSGGWNPTVHLFSQSGGQLAWDEARGLFRPDRSVQACASAGAGNGVLSLAGALSEGARAGTAAEIAAGKTPNRVEPPSSPHDEEPQIEPLWRVDAPGKAFVDFQNDVTADDIALAARENFVSVEHLKRYTTLGMAPDQGKTSNVNALAIMGELTGRSPAQVGTTRYRPPFTPTSLAAYSGRLRGELFRPLKRTPLQAWHESLGGAFEDYGGWARPAAYPRAGEDLEAAVRRETLAVRRACGLFDASPLGKIEVTGPDAAAFLDLIYANTMSTLAPGKVRYGLMLNELGVIIDDGVCARLGLDTFLVGTTSGGVDRMAAAMEEWLQCEWTHLRVLIAPVTTDWAVINLAGPNASKVLDEAGCSFDPSPSAFPHMTFRLGEVAKIPARVFRVSFSGEVSYEINVPSDQAPQAWDALFAAGGPYGLEPFGVESLMRLRVEKGFLHVGSDTDGTTLPADVGWTKVVDRKVDFIGKRSLLWAHARSPDRLQFVGLEPLDRDFSPKVGAHLRPLDGGRPTVGFVTSAGYSPTLERGVALGLLEGGRARMGEELELAGAGRRVRVVAPAAYDPEGARLNG